MSRWNDEQRERDKAHKRAETRFAIVCFSVLAVVILAVMLIHAVVIYDDWRCAFAECRLEK